MQTNIYSPPTPTTTSTVTQINNNNNNSTRSELKIGSNQHTITNNEGDLLNSNLKGRNSNSSFTKTVKSTDSLNSQRNLDDWLENCLRDPPNFINSTEFIDNNNHHQQQQNQHHYNFGLQQPQQQQIIPNMFRNSPGLMRNSNPLINVNYSSPTFKPNAGPSNYYNNYLNPIEKSLNMLQISMNQDFASLPPIINMTNNHNNNSENNTETNGFQDLLTVEYNQNRRFSDPGLAGNSEDNDSQNQECSEPPSQIIDSKTENSKLLATLLKQINLLHETNTKICRNLHETKVEIEALKHTPSWGLRHRRDSISGLSTHSQPLGFNFGTQSPTPTYHSGNYTPGMLTDVVREVREAARVREEALLNRVKALVDERSWGMNENNFKLMRELEELKIQMQQIKADKKETNLKMNKLEEELKMLKTFLSHTLTNSRHNFLNSLPNRTDSKYNNHRIKRHSSTNINYGIFNNNDDNNLYNLHNHNTDNNEISSINNINNAENQNQQQNYNRSSQVNRNNNSERFNNDTIEEKFLNLQQHQHNKSIGTEVQLEKDTLELRRELQDALFSRNQATNRILALEQMVLTLQNNKNPIQSSISIENPYINNTNINNNSTSVLKIIEPTISQAEPQVATHIHTNVSSVNRKILPQNNFTLTGPVTDL